MNKFLAGFIVLALLASSNVYAVVYNYTGPNFTNVSGAYTTSMRVTGSFSTSSPIPPNSDDFDATGIVTSWSFFDGLQSINSTNGVIYPNSFLFTTDGTGNITEAEIAVVDSPLATQVGQTNDVITISTSGLNASDSAGIDLVCTAVTNGICSDAAQSQDYATVDATGAAWTQVTVTVDIPTLSTWGIAALILLLGTLAFARRRLIS